nr:PTS glucose transporter subunit IIA [Maridesulfovibrio hydrothermalis]
MGAMKREEAELMESHEVRLFSPIDGEVVPIEDTPDPVFADKSVGDGVSIIPTGDTMYAPADGTIGKIFKTNHAFSMITDDGVELFVHFGVDTVNLKGEGFTRVAEQGATVKKGDPVIHFDLGLLTEKAKSVITPVVISNMDEFGEMTKVSGKVAAGDPILYIKKK